MLMTWKDNDGQMGKTIVTGYTLCWVDWVGFRPQGFLEIWQMIGQVACVTSVRGC